MTGQNSFWFANPSTGFYPFEIGQSIRITGNGYLNMSTNGFANAPTLDTKGTISFWIKLQNNDSRNYVIQSYTANSNNGAMDIRIGGSDSNDGMHIGQYGRTPYTASTTGPKQRDYNNFYHILVSFDSTSATSSDRDIQIHINGTQVTAGTFNGTAAIGQNDKFPFTAQGSTNGGFTIGRHPTVGYYTDCIIAELNLIDGQRLAPTYFGETKNGVWIPKEYTGTYGNNGCRFTFASSDFNVSGSSVSDPNGSSVDLFNNGISDASGNGNHLNLNSVSTHDILLDSPTNNFSTLNENDARYGTLDEGNLKNTYASTGELIRSTFAQKSGKWYAEVNCIAGSGFNLGIYPTGNLNKDSDTNYGCQYRGATGQKVVSNSVSSYGATYGADDIIGIAVDMDNNTVTFYKNNSSQGSISYTIDEHHAFSSYISSGNTAFWNFGQDSSFGGNETAQGNQDENGVGDFYYAPPSGYLALCSSNLPDTTLSPNQDEQATDYFNTVTYTGDGNSSNAITGVGFQPDWIWIKERSGAANHGIHDSSRVISGAEEVWYTNATNAANTGGAYISSFDSDGFTLNNNSSGNTNSDTYVAWNWKLNGGTTVSNSNGSITSTTQASTTAGISIVTWTGNFTDGASVGHGLGVVPTLVFIKNRDDNQGSVFNINTTTPYRVNFNSDAGDYGDFAYYNGTYTSNNIVFNNRHSAWNGNTDKMVAYAFHSVEGFSKLGLYIGNGSTNGTFVYTGFRPAWILFKRISDDDSFIIHDNKRDPHNVATNNLFPDGDFAEDSNASNRATDFLSNGFKLRSSAQFQNNSGHTYFYMAFAEQPFKFSNAR